MDLVTDLVTFAAPVLALGCLAAAIASDASPHFHRTVMWWAMSGAGYVVAFLVPWGPGQMVAVGVAVVLTFIAFGAFCRAMVRYWRVRRGVVVVDGKP